MKTQSNHFLVGLFLIILGAFLLLNSIGQISLDEENVMAIIFFSGGAVLIAAHFLYKKPLWTLIVGSCSTFIGSAIWSICLTLVGYYLGEAWDKFFIESSSIFNIIAIIIISIIAIIILLKYLKRNKHDKKQTDIA